MNYKSAYDKKLTQEPKEEDGDVKKVVVEDEEIDPELDSALDNDLTELINDIDQEEGNFDLDDDE